MKILKKVIKEEVEDYLDHKNLNEQIPEFETMIPTAENIAIVIYNKLRPMFEESLKIRVKLYETPRNFVEYWGE